LSAPLVLWPWTKKLWPPRLIQVAGFFLAGLLIIKAGERLNTAGLVVFVSFLLVSQGMALLWGVHDSGMGFAFLTCSLVMVGILCETWIQLHYMAPVTGLIFVFVLSALRRLYHWPRHRPTGRSMVRALLLISVFTIIGAIALQYQTLRAYLDASRRSTAS